MKNHIIGTTIALTMLALGTSSSRADFIVNVSLDTSALASDSGQGPFAVDFQLNDGSGAGGDGNNTAVVSNFNLNGGSLGADNPLATPPGSDVSGNLSSTFTITDAGSLGGFNDFNQAFSPRSSLSFTVDIPNPNLSPAEDTSPNAPDEFSFTVYSNLNSVNGPSQTSLLTIDITGPNPSISTSGGSLGDGTPVPAPTYSAVPEPASLGLFGLGMGMMAAGAWRGRKGAA